ncbi:MAG: LTA synthase family protein [Flavobacteriales bacterium]|nr:LTA synthase family protein [Flavobacteriales bacterium]
MSGALWRRFIAGWAIALLSLCLTRLIFFINNFDTLHADAATVALSFLHGVRFDAVSTAYALLPFILLLPVFLKLRGFLRLYFVAAVGAMNMLNCIDAEFFRFISRRSTDDLFRFAFISDDIYTIGPDLVRDFWYLVLLWALVMLLVLWLYNRVIHPVSTGESSGSRIMATVSMMAFALLTVVAMRGGMQRIPIGIIDAGQAHDPRFSVLELNSSFTMLKTFGKPDLPELQYFEDDENPMSPILTLQGALQGHLRGHNVVVLIVESLGSEYMGRLNGLGHTYTPFIDSLCNEGLLFTNAFANGHRSIEGIPACMAALPTLMYEPFITSRYAQNHFSSLPNLLGPLGYTSYFMHGGENGTMGLLPFANQAGFDHYLGKNEYPDPSHYDGHWGIFDHHFLHHATEVFSAAPKPFVAGIFTLSSHHPYSVPEELRGRFPVGNLPIHESIGYGDYSVRRFFEDAKRTDWYDNTLFVITADHTSLSEFKEFQTTLGSLSIPILFFHPNDTLLKGTSDITAQQVDIMPSVLSLLGYEEPFFSLGQNVFDSTAHHMAVAFKFDRYQMLLDGKLLTFDGEQTLGLHDFEREHMLHTDVKGEYSEDAARHERILKGYLQNYTRALVRNRMTAETWQANDK